MGDRIATSGSALEDLYFGDEGLVTTTAPGSTLVDLSAATPNFAREINAVATVNDLIMVEAPATVRSLVAADAFARENLLGPVATEAELTDDVRRLLDAIFGEVVEVGAPGRAQLLRNTHTLPLAADLVSAIEAVALDDASARSVGALDADQIPLFSPVSADPVVQAVRQQRYTGDYTAEMLLAELSAALMAADDAEVILPGVEATMHLLELLVVIGGADMAPAALSLVYQDEAAGTPGPGSTGRAPSRPMGTLPPRRTRTGAPTTTRTVAATTTSARITTTTTMTTSLPITTTSTTRTTSCDSPESELRDTLIRSDSPRSAEMPTGHFRSLRNSLGQGIPHPLYALPLSCELCPRRCGVDRAAGERGVCGAAGEVLVARAALHFWEEPPISGEDGSGTIFFSGCPLRCVYCQNASIALGEAARAITVERLAAIMGELEAAGALNINCVTPTHFAPQIRAAVALAREQGMALPVLWNTGGYETVEAVRGNVGFVDAYLTDFKYADAALAARYSHAADYPEVALAALQTMVEVVGAPCYDEFRGQERLVSGVVVRHLMLPGALDNSKAVVRLLHERFGSDVRLSLMNQYTPVIAQAAAAGDRRAAAALAASPSCDLRYPIRSSRAAARFRRCAGSGGLLLARRGSR